MDPLDESFISSPKSSSSYRQAGSESDTPPTSSGPLATRFLTSPPCTAPFPESMGFTCSSMPPSPLFATPFTQFGSFSTPPLASYPAATGYDGLSIAEDVSIGRTIAGGEGTENLSSVPQPLQCLQELPVPPFLSKTFDIVDDPALNPIISWGPSGESFVVWDPVEFSRVVLPQNFKHNNFSSFVRQLNTYGFRKIDADKWEFANEGFLQGKKNMLKNIQRRKPVQSQQVGSSRGLPSGTGKAVLESEIEKLRKEKSLMMQEVIELQQQQSGAVQHMETVKVKLQAAEQRQKQMVSFLAKAFQNPGFLARLQRKKDQKAISSPRLMRKFIKHQQEPGEVDSSTGGQIIKYRPGVGNLSLPSMVPELMPIAIEQIPHSFSPDTEVVQDLGGYTTPFPTENIDMDEFVAAHELEIPTHVGEGISTSDYSQPVITPKYFVSFTEDSTKGTNVQELLDVGSESCIKQEDVWDMGFDASAAGMISSSNDLWGNFSDYDAPELGLSSGMSDFWDLSSIQGGGGSGTDIDINAQTGQPEDNIAKKIDP